MLKVQSGIQLNKNVKIFRHGLVLAFYFCVRQFPLFIGYFITLFTRSSELSMFADIHMLLSCPGSTEDRLTVYACIILLYKHLPNPSFETSRKFCVVFSVATLALPLLNKYHKCKTI
jgi:hypothetical protein